MSRAEVFIHTRLIPGWGQVYRRNWNSIFGCSFKIWKLQQKEHSFYKVHVCCKLSEKSDIWHKKEVFVPSVTTRTEVRMILIVTVFISCRIQFRILGKYFCKPKRNVRPPAGFHRATCNSLWFEIYISKTYFILSCPFCWPGYLSRYSDLLWAGRSGTESLCGPVFPHVSRPILGTSQPLQGGYMVFSRGKSDGSVALTTPPHLVPRLKKG
jgi:hypothetical protein